MSEAHNRSLGSSARVAIARLGASNLLVLASTCLSLGLTLNVFWPSLRERLFADDYVAMSMLDGKFGAARAPLDLFNFADGSPEDVTRLRELGSIPWWAPDDFRVSFLRPLSSALWHVDRALFGLSYAYYHAHSLLVFSLLVIATALLYRRLFPGVIAALALVIFAVDDSHQFPVLWLSNRGGIYASLCGVLAVLAHLRWRERGERRYAYLSALAIALGFSFGEWALPMLAYILAYELLGARDAVRSRLLALLPSAVSTVLFLGVRAYLQYGARGSGAYIDPGVDPLRFLLTACHRVPIFMADMMWNVPAEWWDQGSPPWRDELMSYGLFPPSIWVKLPDWRFWHIALGALACAALGLGYRFCRPGLSESESRHLRWFVFGSLGALVPVVGSFPSTRLTIASFLGVAPLLACVFREVARRLRAAPRVQPMRFVVSYLVILGLVHIQFVAPLQTDIQARVDWFTTTSNWVLAAELDPQRVAQQRVFLVSGFEFTTTFYFAYIWSLHGLPRPRTYYPLTASPIAHFIERAAENELVLEGASGNYFGSGHENMFHAPARTWREGQTIALDGLRITIERVERGGPNRLRFTFDRSLDDPSYAFLVARPSGLVRFTPPPVGTSQLLARAASPSWFELDRHRYLRRIAPLPEVLGFSPVPGMVYYKPP